MTDPTLVGRPLTLRPATADDEPFLEKVYAGTRAAELAAVPWTEEEKAAFLQMQFAAQAQYYREHYPDASFDVILLDADGRARRRSRRAALRRPLDRRDPHRRHRPAARVLQPRHRDHAPPSAPGRSAGRGQAAPHPRRALQPRAAALRAARLPADRG